MPTYPTNNTARAHQRSTVPQRSLPDTRRKGKLLSLPAGNDNRGGFRPRPATKGIKVVPRPAYSPIAARTSSGLRFVPGVGLIIGAAIIADNVVNYEPLGAPMPNYPVGPGFKWYLRHGPNTYPGYSSYSDPQVQRNGIAWMEPAPIGPETGKITGQAISPSNRLAIGTPIESWRDTASYWLPNSDFSRFAQTHAFQKVLTQNQPAYEAAGGVALEDLAPVRFPTFDPLTLPSWWPVPEPIPATVPVPIPRAPTPVRAPSPNIPGHQAVSIQPPWIPPRSGDVPGPGWYETPSIDYEFTPGNPPRANPGTHPLSKPPPGTSEGKGRLRRGFDKAMDIFGDATEVLDVVDSAWKALPDRCRTKTYYKGRINTSIKDKIADVFKCAGHMSINDFLLNLIDNHVEDFIIGRVSKLRADVIPDGIAGVDLFRWIDEFLFGGEISKAIDLSKYVGKTDDLFETLFDAVGVEFLTKAERDAIVRKAETEQWVRDKEKDRLRERYEAWVRRT